MREIVVNKPERISFWTGSRVRGPRLVAEEPDASQPNTACAVSGLY